MKSLSARSGPTLGAAAEEKSSIPSQDYTMTKVLIQNKFHPSSMFCDEFHIFRGKNRQIGAARWRGCTFSQLPALELLHLFPYRDLSCTLRVSVTSNIRGVQD
jgi:hypothetical protein